MNSDYSYKYDSPAAARLLVALGYPSDGDGWDQWFKKAWKHLDDANLLSFDSPADRATVSARLMALHWIALDFCALCNEDEYYETLEFVEWARVFQLESLALYLAINSQNENAILHEAPYFNDDGYFEMEETGEVHEQEVVDDLLPRLVFTVVEQERDSVAAAISEGFGGPSSLFASLYAARKDMSELTWERKEQLRERKDELRDLISTSVRQEDVEHLRKELVKIDGHLKDENLEKYVRKEIENCSLTDDVFFGDETSIQRLNGHEWCGENCPRFIVMSFPLE